MEPYQRQASVSGVEILKHFMETRVGVASGGGAICVVAPPFSVLSTAIMARPAASFWLLVQQV